MIFWLRTGSIDGMFKHDNQSSVLVKVGELLGQMSSFSFTRNNILCYMSSRLKELSFQIL
jgi:hypothetical protein